MINFFDFKAPPWGPVAPIRPKFYWTDDDEVAAILFALKLLARSGPLSVTTVAIVTEDAVAAVRQRGSVEALMGFDGFVSFLCQRLGLLTGRGLIEPVDSAPRSAIHRVAISAFGRTVLKDATRGPLRLKLTPEQQAIVKAVP